MSVFMIYVYKLAFMVPSKIYIVVVSLQLTPAHTCIFNGCFGLKRSIQNSVKHMYFNITSCPADLELPGIFTSSCYKHYMMYVCSYM